MHDSGNLPESCMPLPVFTPVLPERTRALPE
jgi:hypothetical protein